MARPTACLARALLPCLALIATLTGCGADVGAGVRSLGTFQLCLHRLVDGCGDAAGVCRSDPGKLLSVSLSELPNGTLRWSTGGVVVMEGRRVGRRFELRSLQPVEASLCGCSARLSEVMRGELYEARTVMPTCNFTEDQGGCGSEAPSAFFADGLPGDNWLGGGSAIDPDAVIGSLRAVVWDTAAPAEGTGCGCLPCAARFELQGVQ